MKKDNNINIHDVSTPALAYLGDCVIELLVRRRLVSSGIGTSKALNSAALNYVSAPAQAEAMKRLLPHLTEEEEGYFRRGRNIGHTNTPKRATVSEYRAATGMESLFGYLHLTGQMERAEELFSKAYASESDIRPSDE